MEKKPTKPRAPLKTFRELCEIIGESEQKVRGYMAQDSKNRQPFPKARVETSSNRYFDPKEFLNWWKSRR